MKCYLCRKAFKEGDKVLPIATYVTDERRGDFVSNVYEYVHVFHLKVAVERPAPVLAASGSSYVFPHQVRVSPYTAQQLADMDDD